MFSAFWFRQRRRWYLCHIWFAEYRCSHVNVMRKDLRENRMWNSDKLTTWRELLAKFEHLIGMNLKTMFFTRVLHLNVYSSQVEQARMMGSRYAWIFDMQNRKQISWKRIKLSINRFRTNSQSLNACHRWIHQENKNNIILWVIPPRWIL